MSVDLATVHQPVGRLFDGQNEPASPEFRLDREQLQHFDDRGFLGGIRILNEDQLQAMRVEVQELAQPSMADDPRWYEYHSNESTDPDTILFHALGAWRLRESLHDVLWHRAFTVPASQLLKGPVRFWHDQLFCKPAHHGGVVAWHQDYSYWTRTEPMAHLTCWIGLDDSTVDNGCLHYIPGSHRWPLLPITGLAGDMTAIRNVLNDEQWDQFQHPVAVELKAGECAFHHPLMVHGSFENRTSQPRRATVINVVRDGVRSASDEALLQNVPVVKRGNQLDGQFFPLLSPDVS